MTGTIKVDPAFQHLLPPLSDDERAQLEANLMEYQGARDPLTVWKEQGILLDGHNRYAICQKHQLTYKLDYISLPDARAAKMWVFANHLGRRNFTPEQTSYLRGVQYELSKNGDDGKVRNNSSRTLAAKHKVDQKTILNDAKFARSVDAIAEAAGDDARDALLARNTKLERQDVNKLGDIARANPRTAKNLFEVLKTADKPYSKKLVRDTARDVESVPELTLTEPPTKRKTIEPVALKGGEGYIIRNPGSEPIFNRTNEMVDWASWTWNPVTGCWHGCDYCYAREIANDQRMSDAYPKKFEPVFHEARLDAPKNTPQPEIKRPEDRNVFTCSMADLFGKWVPDEWILKVMERVRLHQEWNFLFLTKFPQRLRDICDKLKGFPPNAWMGCTVDGQARVSTAEQAFKGLRAKVRWLSVEPMQERLTFRDLSMFQWLVVGGKSASYFNNTPASQPEWEWVEHLWKQARAAGVKIYWKDNLKVKPKEVPWSSTRHAPQ